MRANLKRYISLLFILITICGHSVSAANFLKFTGSRNNYSLGNYKIGQLVTDSAGEVTAGEISVNASSVTFEVGLEAILFSQYGINISYQNFSFSSDSTEYFNRQVIMSIDNSPISLILKGYFWEANKKGSNIYMGLGFTIHNSNVQVKALDNSFQIKLNPSYQSTNLELGYEYLIGSIAIGLKFANNDGKNIQTSSQDGVQTTIEVGGSYSVYGLTLSLLY